MNNEVPGQKEEEGLRERTTAKQVRIDTVLMTFSRLHA
jgi:hypothetical protein